MLTKPIAVVGLVVGVIVAAGAGAYLAVRQNAAAPPQLVEADAESVTSGLASTEPGEPVGSAVEATEAAVDTLETAVAFELIEPSVPALEFSRVVFDVWMPFATAMNVVNRSLGQRDLYPFVLPDPVVDKLVFVDSLRPRRAGAGGGPCRVSPRLLRRARASPIPYFKKSRPA